MAALEITNENFETLVLKSTKPVIIDVHAVWCGPCQMMAPVFESLSKELGDRYTFVSMNVDEARDLSIKFGITSVPTFIFLKDGIVKAKETGYMSKETLQEKIESILG
jgi:thioredoxin 1